MAAGQREVDFKAAALKNCISLTSDWIFVLMTCQEHLMNRAAVKSNYKPGDKVK